MIRIIDKAGFASLLKSRKAILFFDVEWSAYATISKQMMNHVELYAKPKAVDVEFYSMDDSEGFFPLFRDMEKMGITQTVFGGGGGSIVFFYEGSPVGEIISVIGEGTNAVWKKMEELFGVKR